MSKATVLTVDDGPLVLRGGHPESARVGLPDRRGPMKQVASAVGEGAMSVDLVHRYQGMM